MQNLDFDPAQYDRNVVEQPYTEDCEADRDLVDLTEAAEVKGHLLG